MMVLTISPADSLYAMEKGPGAPTKFITTLQTWLKASFGKWFKSFGNSLGHAVQDDSYSCGIIAANTITHAVLDHPLCNGKNTTEERLKWFIHFASLYPAKSASVILSKDIDMPNIPKQTQNARLVILDLLNPIDDGEFELPAVTSYDSDGSSDSEDLRNMPLQPPQEPEPKPATLTPQLLNNNHKCTRADSSTDSGTESSDGYSQARIPFPQWRKNQGPSTLNLEKVPADQPRPLE